MKQYRIQGYHMQLQSTELWQRCQEHTVEKIWSLQQVVLGKLDSHIQKNLTPHSKINAKY
jgi:hypothetical protein